MQSYAVFAMCAIPTNSDFYALKAIKTLESEPYCSLFAFVLCPDGAPHRNEERHGEVGHEAVVDAQRHIFLARSLRYDG